MGDGGGESWRTGGALVLELRANGQRSKEAHAGGWTPVPRGRELGIPFLSPSQSGIPQVLGPWRSSCIVLETDIQMTTKLHAHSGVYVSTLVISR